MPDSPNLWDAFTAVIEAGANAPNDADGIPILDAPDTDGGGLWPRVHRGKTTPNALEQLPPPGYALLGQMFENEAGCYNGEAGQDGLYRITWWGKTPDDALRLYRWGKGLLHEVPLTVAGYQPVTGIVSKSGPFPDPDGTAFGVEATYRAEPFEA